MCSFKIKSQKRLFIHLINLYLSLFISACRLLMTKVKLTEQCHSTQSALVVCHGLLKLWNDLYKENENKEIEWVSFSSFSCLFNDVFTGLCISAVDRYWGTVAQWHNQRTTILGDTWSIPALVLVKLLWLKITYNMIAGLT